MTLSLLRNHRKLLAAVLLAAPATLLAQEQATTPGPQAGPTGPLPENWHAAINPYASHTFNADFGDTGTSMNVSRLGVDVDGRIPLSHELNFDLGLIGEYSNYQFSNPAPLPDFNLDLLDVKLAPGLSYQLSDEWSVFGGVLLEAAGSAGADLDQSMMYGGYVGFRQKVSDKLSYTVGVGARSQIEDDCQAFPLLGLEWAINPGLSLSLAGSAGGAQLRLSQSLVYDLAVSLVTGYEGRQYRLDNSPVTGPEGVFRDARLPLGVELAWRPSPTFTLRGSAGYVLWQEIEFDDSDGNQITKNHPDPAPYVGLSANWQF